MRKYMAFARLRDRAHPQFKPLRSLPFFGSLRRKDEDAELDTPLCLWPVATFDIRPVGGAMRLAAGFALGLIEGISRFIRGRELSAAHVG